MNEQEYTYCGSKVSKEMFNTLVGLRELHDYVADDRFSLSLRDHDFNTALFYQADTFKEYISLYNKENPDNTIQAEDHDFGEHSFIWLKRVDAGLDAISQYQGQLEKQIREDTYQEFFSQVVSFACNYLIQNEYYIDEEEIGYYLSETEIEMIVRSSVRDSSQLVYVDRALEDIYNINCILEIEKCKD